MNEAKQFYYLVVGNVIVNTENGVQGIPQNAMIITDNTNIGVHQLGKAQQALQVTLFKKLGENLEVIDVIVTNLVLLGEMTEAEFNARPEGLAVQERVKPSAEVIDFTASIKAND